MKYKYKSKEKKKLIKDFNKRYCFVNIGTKSAIYDLKLNIPKTKQSVIDFCANKQIWSDEDSKYFDAFFVWMKNEKRNTAEEIIFDPSKNQGFNKKKKTVNEWRGFAVKPKKGDWSLMQDHIKNVICSGNKKHYEYLIQWLARVVQEPGGARPGVAINLYGKKGTGKSFFVTLFSEIFHESHFYHASSIYDIIGKNNSLLSKAVVVLADEANFKNVEEKAGRLKALITEKKIIVEEKFIPKYQVTIHANFIFSSNEVLNVPVTDGERRFFALEVSDKHRKDIPYFDAIYKQMKSGGLEAMYFDLLKMDFNLNFLRKAPKTAQLKDQIERSEGTIQIFHRYLKSGEIKLVSEDNKVFRYSIYDQYKTLCGELKEHPKIITSFYKDFYKCGPEKMKWKNEKKPLKAYSYLDKVKRWLV